MALLCVAAIAGAEGVNTPLPEVPPAAPLLPPAPAYPASARTDVVEDHFGVAVRDPYRWLEGDQRSDPRIARWISDQNVVTRAYLDALPGRDIWAAQLTALVDYDRVGLPRKAGQRYFFLRGRGSDAQMQLYARTGLTGRDRLLLNPADWSADASATLAEWAPGPGGHTLAYTVQQSGSDWRQIRLFDVDKGLPLADTLDWVKFSAIAWDQSGRGFFYSRYPAPPPGEEFRAGNLNHAVWYHRVGTAQTADRLVHSTPDAPARNHHAAVTDDGRYLIVRSNAGTDDRHGVTLYPLAGGRIGKAVPLVTALVDRWQLVGSRSDRLIFLTSNGAPRGRIVTIDARAPHAMVELLAEGPRILDSATRVGDRIITAYLDDPDADVRLITLDGRPAGRLRLNEIGTASGFAGRAGDPETFFAFTGFTQPPIIVRYNVESGAVTAFAAPAPTFDAATIVVRQQVFIARDGTRVPLYIVARRDVLARGDAPTILYGYGGFAKAQTPTFLPMRTAWVLKGGVFALAGIRGGGEFGAAWHDAGRLFNKQTSFNDFIDAGEYLIAQHIAAPGRLAIAGRSNGGLLVGAVTNQRPDLFAAALPGVGVMDMVRFDRFTAGRYWIDDYGDPAAAPDFRNLLAYSPYHNIRGGRDYPAILVSTADTDDRVVPAHSFKYAAALQAAAIGSKPHLIRIESRAGHGAGRSADKVRAEWIDQLAFVAAHTGLDVK